MDLEAYRRSAESFVSELMGAYYRHYSGLEDQFEIEPIYQRHAKLFEPEAVERLRELTAASPGDSEQRRRALLLLDFAVDGCVGQSTKELEAGVARTEAAATLELGNERIGFREASVIQANERDPSRREEIEQARLQVTETRLNPLYRELVARQHECAGALGFSSYRDMCQQCKGIDLTALASQTGVFSAATDPGFAGVLEPEVKRTLGLELSELRRSDLPRFFRAPEEDRHFPAERLLASLVETLRGLGIFEQDNVVLDVERRPNKSPRAFCAPVRVPQEVYLVIAPVGGRDDFSALFHEAGHTEHYAHVDRKLPFEYRYLGDNSITEAYAFLVQNLVEDPEWLERRLGVLDAGELTAYARAYRLVFLRRYAAKLAYELELHGGQSRPEALAGRYAQLLGSALRIEWPEQMYLADIDPAFYCACYLRAWALETRLRAYLRRRFGPAWFESAEAGETLRTLWREGQRRRPEELLGELTGEPLDFGVMLTDLGLTGVGPTPV